MEYAEQILRFLDGGITIAGVTLYPARILLGMLVAWLLIILVRRLRDRLSEHWLKSTRLDAGERESLATILGYIGITLALMIGLSIAGVDLTNLAIIAGALSVGIGFGLQTIVNNFVSGLILLFERPVRPGDFVCVGSVEGIVRKIHIRATEIETLDRVSVVVPNSDLISSPVQNWRLRDPYTRITVRVGVAYGSDTELVSRLLREAGLSHEQVLPDGTPGVPNCNVVFQDFGDSALIFDLRVYVRDLTQRAIVASDIRHTIDKAFKANGISIPFPQRDVWMRGAPDSEGVE